MACLSTEELTLKQACLPLMRYGHENLQVTPNTGHSWHTSYFVEQQWVSLVTGTAATWAGVHCAWPDPCISVTASQMSTAELPLLHCNSAVFARSAQPTVPRYGCQGSALHDAQRSPLVVSSESQTH